MPISPENRPGMSELTTNVDLNVGAPGASSSGRPPPSPLLAGNGRTVSRETTFHVKPRQALARPHLWPEIELCDPVKRGAWFCPSAGRVFSSNSTHKLLGLKFILARPWRPIAPGARWLLCGHGRPATVSRTGPSPISSIRYSSVSGACKLGLMGDPRRIVERGSHVVERGLKERWLFPIARRLNN